MPFHGSFGRPDASCLPTRPQLEALAELTIASSAKVRAMSWIKSQAIPSSGLMEKLVMCTASNSDQQQVRSEAGLRGDTFLVFLFLVHMSRVWGSCLITPTGVGVIVVFRLPCASSNQRAVP